MKDNIKRALRTAGQSLLGFLGAGGADLVFRNYISNHGNSFDPTLFFVIGIGLTGLAGLAQNVLEDWTGVGILIPKDRKLGDEVLGTGVGAKLIPPTK